MVMLVVMLLPLVVIRAIVSLPLVGEHRKMNTDSNIYNYYVAFYSACKNYEMHIVGILGHGKHCILIASNTWYKLLGKEKPEMQILFAKATCSFESNNQAKEFPAQSIHVGLTMKRTTK